jgi:hypothetical protein
MALAPNPMEMAPCVQDEARVIGCCSLAGAAVSEAKRETSLLVVTLA